MDFVLQLLNLTVHFVDEGIALLRGGIEETEVVLVGLYLTLQLLVLAHQTCTLVVEGIATTLGNLTEIVLKLAETALGNTDVEFLIELVNDSVILCIDFVFLLEGNMADCLVLLNQLLYFLLQTFARLGGNGLQLFDDATFLLQVLVFLATA